MKRRLRRLIVFAGVLGVLMVLNVGAASADNGGPAFEDANAIADANLPGPPPASVLAAMAAPGAIPVGSNILESQAGVLPPGHAGADNGFGRLHEINGDEIPGAGGTDGTNPAVIAIANNPNCPLHYAP